MAVNVITGSTYSYSFYSTEINKVKYDIIKDKSLIIRDFKNKISAVISKDLDKYVEYTKNDFFKAFNTQIKGLTGQDIQIAILHVYTTYSNKFKQINKKINFKVQDKINIEWYKKNTKNNKKGDLKNFEVVMKSTKLTKCMSYISKYGNPDLVNYLNRRILTEKNSNLILFFNEILHYIDKFGFDRLYNLGLSKRNRLVAQYNKKIEFKSLSYRTITRIKHDILGYNKNYNSDIKAFVTVGGYFDKDGKKLNLSIPIAYSKKHHGLFSSYESESYTVCIEGKRIRFILAKDGDRDVITFDSTKPTLGADVNVKHNLFSLSSEEIIDYERDMLGDYIKFLHHLDEVKAEKSKLKLPKEEVSRLSNKNSRQLEKWTIMMDDMLTRECSKLVEYCSKNNYFNLVLENLGQFGKGFSKSEEFEGFKYTRLISLLKLADLKHTIKSIAYKNGISLTLVHPEYSSQTCHKCKHVSKDNRKSQEVFECVSCGMKCNADYNSAINILERLSLDVLRNSLLKVNKFGEYEPRKLSKFKIKDVISSSYSCNSLISS